jgi:hypothetical protein
MAKLQFMNVLRKVTFMAKLQATNVLSMIM